MGTDSWRIARIGECGHLRNGVNFSSRQEGIGLPVLKVKDFSNHFFVPLNTLDELDPSEITIPDDQLLSDGDTVIIRSNGNPELVGRCLFVQGVERPTTFSGFCIRFRPMRSIIHARFASYLIRSPICRARFVAFGSGTGIQNLNQATIGGATFQLPPIDEQREISSILGALDDKIELNRQMNRMLEEIAQAIFKSWFVDFDPVVAKAAGRQPFGMSADTAALFPDRFVESELGPIPEGWRTAILEEIADNLRRGTNPSTTGSETPYIGLEHMPRRSIAVGNWGKANDVFSGKFAFRRGEILFGKLRPYFHKVGVAPIDGVCSTDILVLIPKKEEWFGLLLGYVTSDVFIDYVDGASHGTRMPRTSWKDMANFQIPLPDVRVAQEFTGRTRLIVGKIHSNLEEGRTLAALRDLLLPKLLSGEIRVRQAEGLVQRAGA